ncbi:hypothetical protein KAR48_20295 [bacterium]|nr:hypothetical protein [bacterium]
MNRDHRHYPCSMALAFLLFFMLYVDIVLSLSHAHIDDTNVPMNRLKDPG